MSQSNFVSFDDFVTRKYLNLPDRMQALYGSYERFVHLYLANEGFNDWLETIKGSDLADWEMDNIARTYFHRAERSEAEVVTVLVDLARYYDIRYPTIEGCLTAEFWEAVAAQDCWHELYRNQDRAA